MKGYDYDPSKRMWSRHRSTCHNAPLTQKMLYLGKVVTEPNFQIVTSSPASTKQVPTNKRWWQFRKPKFIKEITPAGSNTKDVQFRYYCDKCGKQNNGEWKFRHKK